MLCSPGHGRPHLIIAPEYCTRFGPDWESSGPRWQFCEFHLLKTNHLRSFPLGPHSQRSFEASRSSGTWRCWVLPWSLHCRQARHYSDPIRDNEIGFLVQLLKISYQRSHCCRWRFQSLKTWMFWDFHGSSQPWLSEVPQRSHPYREDMQQLLWCRLRQRALQPWKI